MPVKRTGTLPGSTFGCEVNRSFSRSMTCLIWSGLGVEAQMQNLIEQKAVALRQVFKGHGRELRIWHADHCPIVGPNTRRAQSDVLDGAHLVAELTEVTDQNRAGRR